MTDPEFRQITAEQLHSIEWVTGWQYLTVWREAKAGEPFTLDDPPAGEGWVPNVDREGGAQIVVPRWSDGRVVHQLRYWRRPVEGMQPWHSEARKSICQR